MNEENFTAALAALFSQRQDVLTGPGDDCAVLDLGLPVLLLAAVDQVISGVHYLPDCPPALSGGKLLRRNVSDIAAMGGVPTHALLSLAVNPLEESWLLQFHKAIAEECEKYGMSVIGGDIAKLFTQGEVLSLSILGTVERDKLCLRSNACEGDWLYATGCFGNSFYSGHHLTFHPRLAEGRFLAGRFTNAMQDVSDGLLKDACRFAASSGLALHLDPDKIPLRRGVSVAHGLTDGEDYELLFAVSPEKADELERSWNFPETGLSRIGQFQKGTPGHVTGLEQVDLSKFNTGYDHFK
ncbi:MAG: thiamine-phosphate kinase [Lentisphaeria bacterium]|nr:thiamine-phosphate kinase [Lentisphaeria bacterium]